MPRNKFLLPLLKYNTLYAFTIRTSNSPPLPCFLSISIFISISISLRLCSKSTATATATAFRFDSFRFKSISIRFLARDKTQLMPASILCFLLIPHTHTHTHSPHTQAYLALTLMLTVKSCLLLSAKPALQCTWLLSAAVSSAWA